MAVTPNELPDDAVWRHSFDSEDGGGAEVNRGLGLADAFIDIMFEAGVPNDRVTVAIVVHGEAIFDVIGDEPHRAHVGESEHPNAALVERIIAAGGEIWVCARSASRQGVDDRDLLPGVRVAPSAMTAHADLQRRGFSLNPY
jgi:intracellular sulfur oxidation DsrE/DsrF family protein